MSMSDTTSTASTRLPVMGLSMKAQITAVRVVLAATVVAQVAVCLLTLKFAGRALQQASWGAFSAAAFGFVVATALLYGNIMHQLASLGHLKLRQKSEPPDCDQLQVVHGDDPPPTVFLIPSYKEDLRLVRYAMLSAALQEYGNRRVVLLVDDPPYPSNPEDLDALFGAQRLPSELHALLSRQARRLHLALAAFQDRQRSGSVDRVAETRRLVELYRDVVSWFMKQAAGIKVTDHMDRLFADGVLLRHARVHTEHIERLKKRNQSEDQTLTPIELLHEYRRLAALFRVRMTSFNRKRYINLSHEPNKAMNLNSYIGLIGKCFRTVNNPDGTELLESDEREADFTVPDAKYVVVLDADSMLMPNYAMNLIHILEQPENRRLAVAQSPYIAVPEAPGRLEHTAAATVAIQWIIHLGFTQYDAVFWVGANAILRKEALDDICTEITERGFTLKKYIQDRTHIEDTESTIDLVERGWTLHNSSRPYAYSVTPPDFGSLLIQRRRWANGGLIVLPRLLRYLSSAAKVPRRWLQGFMRVGYLANLSVGSLAILATLIYPLSEAFIVCLVIGGLGHLLVYSIDLRRMGYPLRDLPHIYALNLMLVPVNLGGGCKSLRQAWTGRKTPFKRTPTSGDRTAIPALYVAAEYGLMLFCLSVAIMSFAHGNTARALWSLANVVIFMHIITNFMHYPTPFRERGSPEKGADSQG